MNNQSGFLMKEDREIHHYIIEEEKRQQNTIELIASENFVSQAVLTAQGSVLTNKYAEGYPKKRYYNGCHTVDAVEELAIERLKKLFNCNYANVQPHSGSQANQGVYAALLKPGDTILGMSLDGGGHLTHGAKPNLSGKWFNAVHYNVNKDTFLIDYNEIQELATKYKPKLIIAGFSCYSRKIDFKKFREIADSVNAYLLADIAHISGIIAADYHESPLEYAHVVTSTTHKTLRGPRGGIIMSNDIELGKKFDKSIFPCIQGGPLMHIIAAKAVAFKEASSTSFQKYIKQVILNAQSLSHTLQNRGYDILTGGTDNHIVILDLRNKEGITGQYAANFLDNCGITTNKNAIPFDTTSPRVTSGIRLGSAACTSRGLKEKDFEYIGNIISDILDRVCIEQDNSLEFQSSTRNTISNFMNKFPVPHTYIE